MNEISARGRYVGGGLFRGEFRTLRDGDWKVVREKGEPVSFPSQDAAELAAWRAARAFWQAEVIGVAYVPDPIKGAFKSPARPERRFLGKGRSILVTAR